MSNPPPGKQQQSSAKIAVASQWDRETLNVIKQLIAPNCTDVELSLFQKVCQRTELDPFTNQIRAMRRRSKNIDGEWEEKLSIMTGIDGFRVIALRTNEYMGQDGPMWCGEDGIWREVWLENFAPSAAKVAVYRKGFDHPVVSIARWGAYVQLNKEGYPTKMWEKMGDFMLGKCAEALALRKAFPQQISGLYTEDEIPDADIVMHGNPDGNGFDNNNRQQQSDNNRQQQQRSLQGRQSNTKQNQKGKENPPVDNRPREEKMISYWSNADFALTKENKKPIGEQLFEMLEKMELKNTEHKFHPLSDDIDHSVIGFVAERIELGEQEEWKSLSKARVDLACKEVVNWIRHCLPKEKQQNQQPDNKPTDQPELPK